MEPKKARLIWGIILAAQGIFGVFYLNNDALFIVIWIILILVGGLLIFLHISAVRKYNRLQQEELDARIEGQKLEKTRRSVERSVLEMEEARIKAQTSRIKGESGEVRVCPSCGATNRGAYCEYCGRRL